MSKRGIFIITGSTGEGKTTYAKNLIDFLRTRNIKTGGILSERVMADSKTTGYDLVNIDTREKEAFLRDNEECGSERIGRFTICPKGLAMGNAVLSSLVLKEDMIVIIDEVGLLELGNRGWADCINDLLTKSKNQILLIVRDRYVDDVKNKWNLGEAITFNIKEADFGSSGLFIMEHINA